MIRHNGITIDRSKRTVSHNEITARFPFPRGGHRDISFYAICHLILGSGFSSHQLFELAYGDDPEGGPEMGDGYFKVLMIRWRKLYFERLSLELRAWRIAGVTFYCVVPKYQIPDQRQTNWRVQGRTK